MARPVVVPGSHCWPNLENPVVKPLLVKSWAKVWLDSVGFAYPLWTALRSQRDQALEGVGEATLYMSWEFLLRPAAGAGWGELRPPHGP